jgi:hypothetical protein
MGELFERDPDADSGHRSEDPIAFYELCMEMAMIRTALVRRAFRSRSHELVFGYTSGLDLIGHVAYDLPALQERAYEELNDFVGELRADLGPEDELVLVSDHGLQDGVHTDEAMIASTSEEIVADVESVLDLKAAVEGVLDGTDHQPTPPRYERADEVASASKSSSRISATCEAMGSGFQQRPPPYHSPGGDQ